MLNFYLINLLTFTLIAIFLSTLITNNILYFLVIILAILAIGLSLKVLAKISPKGIRSVVTTLQVILLEPLSLTFVYLLSFLSFFNRSFNSKVDKTPILFVHGYINFSSVWLYHLIRLKRKGYGPLFLINLGFPFSSIESYAKKVKDKINEIKKITKKDNIILIGHSMGGVVSSYYASKYKDHSNIEAIITLGSPLKGTKIAKVGIGKCCRQMEINSQFIEKAQLEYPAEIMYQIVTKKDQLVIPYTSGIVNKEKNRVFVIDDLGHASLLFSAKVAGKIDEWLEKINQK